MHGAIAATALLGFSALVSAVPTPWGSNPPIQGQQAFKFPLSNGFPNISVPSGALTQIERQAHGSIPNSALPTNVSASALNSFRLIAFNEIFEVAYFTSLLNNVTSRVDGYEIGHAAARQVVLNALTAVQAQEELHALSANALLAANDVAPIQPCEYVFPVDCFEEAIALASTFTDVVLGTLADAQFNLGITRDTELISLIGSVIGQEGEQNGYYRALQNKIPSALPFLTTAAGPFAFSALNQLFVVPGSCPNVNTIGLPIFGALTVVTQDIQLKDQTLTFSIPANASTDGLSLVYINQQNVPVVEPLQNVNADSAGVTFQASFPAYTDFLEGLTIAAVTKSAGPFASADAVAAATLFGPGLIEIN